MKLDASLGTRGGYLRSAGETARVAEDLGFAGLWTSETRHDAFLPLAIAANETERIDLGTSVAIAFSRSPMEVAQTAWDLQDLSGGRFILGLGTQVRAHVKRRFSMPWERPVARLREYILSLRAIWGSFQGEGALSFEGEFYRHTLMTPFFNPGPIENPEVPVYIAGVNTSLARLAGELCEGFHVHPFHSPEYVRRTVKPAIAEGAQREGRYPDEVELTTTVFVVTGQSGAEIEEQREEMRAQISFYASPPTYRTRSEEHTSELQSRQYLVCRLLLEKKNNARLSVPARPRPTPRAAGGRGCLSATARASQDEEVQQHVGTDIGYTMKVCQPSRASPVR